MMIDVVVISILSAFLTMFINYTIGKPGSEKFSVYEIFSFYTVWLSKRRLKKVGLLYQYRNQFNENEKRIETESALIQLKNDFKKIYYEAAEPFFTWERAAGMCPICFGVWISFFMSLFFYSTIMEFVIVIITAHIVIRLLTKII
jgi:hypothetical protein